MSVSSDPAVSDALARRRMNMHRELGYESRAMPHIVFRPLHHRCPWPGCEFQIIGIDFQLELLGNDEAYERWLRSWWKGPGLVGRCPGCGNYVLFTMEQKVAVENPHDYAEAILPDDWFEHAYLLAQ